MSAVEPLNIGSELRAPQEAEDQHLLTFDASRPWPRGVPSIDEALAVLADARQVDDGLLPDHCTVASRLPEAVRDAARASLNGLDAPLAAAAATAWRALLAVELAPRAVGLDQPALLDLIGATVAARERLQALRPFVFGDGADFDVLDEALAAALDRLVKEASFRAQPSSRPTRPADASSRVVQAPPARPGLWGALIVALVLALVAQLLGGQGRGRPASWVLIGALESGHAFLAPTTRSPSEGELQQRLREFEARGYVATKTPSGEWALRRPGETR